MRAPLEFPKMMLGLPGLSQAMCEQHVRLYRAYLDQLNRYAGRPLSSMGTEAGRLLNAVGLHEVFFNSLLVGGRGPSDELKIMTKAAFGGWPRLLLELGLAVNQLRGSGWALLVQTGNLGLHVVTIEQHHIGLPMDMRVLYAVDAWEHAYMLDYSTDRAPYVRAVLDNTDWSVVSARVHIHRSEERNARPEKPGEQPHKDGP